MNPEYFLKIATARIAQYGQNGLDELAAESIKRDLGAISEAKLRRYYRTQVRIKYMAYRQELGPKVRTALDIV